MDERYAGILKTNNNNHFDKAALRNMIIEETSKCYAGVLKLLSGSDLTGETIPDIVCRTGGMLKVPADSIPEEALCGVDISLKALPPPGC